MLLSTKTHIGENAASTYHETTTLQKNTDSPQAKTPWRMTTANHWKEPWCAATHKWAYIRCATRNGVRGMSETLAEQFTNTDSECPRRRSQPRLIPGKGLQTTCHQRRIQKTYYRHGPGLHARTTWLLRHRYGQGPVSSVPFNPVVLGHNLVRGCSGFCKSRTVDVP